MKKLTMIILCLCLILSGCKQNFTVYNSSSDIQETIMNEGVSDKEWEKFIEENEKQGVNKEDIHTLENIGYTRMEIIKLSSDDIKNKIIEINKTILNNQKEEIKYMLSDSEHIKNHPDMVITNMYEVKGTRNQERVEEFIENTKNGKRDHFLGIMYSEPVILNYALFQDDLNGKCILIKCIKIKDECKYEEYEIKNIYSNEFFWNFTDNDKISLSIPKTDITYAEKNEISNYKTEENIGKITAKEAILKAEKTASDMKNVNLSSIYGIVIPKTIQDLNEISFEGEILGAYELNGEKYYQVKTVGEDNYEDYYFVSTENDNHILWVEQVNGALVPVSYENSKEN